MTPNNIGFNEANINVMGMFYGEHQITSQKQTNIIGSIVSNYFDMGTNVPAIFQVPAAATALPPGMIGGGSGYSMNVISWQKL